jgi:hypothetical protein
MAYDARTQDNLAKWWITGTGSTINRLSEVMDDEPNGPKVVFDENGWTGPDVNGEWYRALTTKPDDVAENGTARTEGTVGSLGATEWGHSGGNIYTGWDPTDASDTVWAHYAWDGSGAGSAWMTEVVEDEIYRIHINFELGDGSTSTTLNTENEYISFDADVSMEVKIAATFNIGEALGDYGVNGSTIRFNTSSAFNFAAGGTINHYVCTIYNAGSHRVDYALGTAVFKMTTLTGNFNNSAANFNRFQWNTALTSASFDRVNLVNLKTNAIQLSVSPFVDLLTHKCDLGVHFGGEGTKVATDVKISDYITNEHYMYAGAGFDSVVEFVNPKQNVTDILMAGPADSLVWKEQYKVNVHVVDMDGNNLQGVTVACASDSEGAQFSVATAADGTIAEQIVNYKKWETTSSTLTSYSPHTFTISKENYQTIVLENVTIDGPISWRIELKAGITPIAPWQEGMM